MSAHWRNKGLKIGVTGPESCGKSSIVGELHRHFKMNKIDEYARTYFDTSPLNHELNTILHIAKSQIDLEMRQMDTGETFLCDSDLINIQIWLSYYDFDIPRFIEQHLKDKPYDFSILLYPNVAWVDDGLRSNPDDRIALFQQYESALKKYEIPYVIIKDLDEARTQSAIDSLQDFLSKA